MISEIEIDKEIFVLIKVHEIMFKSSAVFSSHINDNVIQN